MTTALSRRRDPQLSGLASLLASEPSAIDLSSPQAATYLANLTALPLESILAEPTDLSSTSSQLTNALTNLCASSYPTFLSLHATTEGLSSTLSSFSDTLTHLLDDIPSLEQTARTFSTEIAGIQSDRRRAALVLEHTTKLQDLLELPLLADACVRNGYFQEALDLAAHAAALAARFPRVPVVQDVRAEVDASVRVLLVQLLALLREPGKLPALFKAVTFLRRMHVLPEPELALAFLTGRLAVLDVALQAVDKARDGDKDSWLRHAKRYVDVWREGVHDAVTQYGTIFVERADADTDAVRALLPAFTAHVLARLLAALRAALPHIADPTALTSLLTQLTYCATAFARLGLDFRPLLPPLFAGAVSAGVAAEFHGATGAWARALETLPPAQLGSPPVDPPAVGGAPHVPPQVLATCPPLANYANALLTTLNGLRLLAPVALLSELSRALDAELGEAGEAFLAYAGANGREEAVRGAGTVFVRVFVPFMRRALVEGVYGAQVTKTESIEKLARDWEAWLKEE
ncbi:Dor1-domain-containing protein [Artomyces pyxidatus]|uniref:Dor1-domain-containing protein n=1 Tax=Artomyces pyxidatus TaxID=48021 RepID=A0ACB8TE89_9AGAM|nr:Dor1-domain-containing protein [Artomyces pyxidatus]